MYSPSKCQAILSSVDLTKDYHELIELIVCDRNSKECMIHRCELCPGVAQLKAFIEGELLKSDDPDEENDNDDTEVSFKQWTTCDRAELINCSLPLDEFIDDLCQKLDEITAHSFIAKAQAQYLNKLKEKLKYDEMIILGDFAENFSFVVQDEIQGYHWNNQQCTLHPIVVYFHNTNESELQSRSICFISDDLKHDVNFVYTIMKNTIKYIHDNIAGKLLKVHYFSDGCAGQYKNCKNFLNLCLHHSDFGVSCEWNFFATSHGKSPCDGIGGTVKRITTRASLQRPINDQILTARKTYEFCVDEIKGIKFLFIKKKRHRQH